MAQVRSETLAKLTCVKCKKYLSHFPIYYTNEGSLCGRCQPPENATRNELYEQAMEFSKFPCCFLSKGCIDRMVPRDIPNHEKWCRYRMLQCPANFDSNCTWKGISKDLYEHFEKKHMVFILPTKSFELDFVNSHNENCLLTFGQDLYVLTRFADSKENVYSCTVNCIGSNPNCTKFFSKFTFKNINGSKEHVLKSKLGEPVEVKKKEINGILGDPMSIIVEIDIVDQEGVDEMEVDECDNPSINYEMLKELECLVSKTLKLWFLFDL